MPKFFHWICGRLFLLLDHLMQLQELHGSLDDHSLATSSMVALDASLLVLRISKHIPLKLIISSGAFQTSGDITTYPGIATTYHLLADTLCHLSGRCRTSRSEKEVNARNSVSLDKKLGQEPM
ncbi:unnamed protein product, partial [Heterotrigona itama]